MVTRPLVVAWALAGFAGAWGGDVAFYGVLKSQQFEQAPGSTPTPLATNAFAFNAFVVATTNGAVTNATVKPPNATPPRTLTADPGGLDLRFEERFATEAELDAAYPSNNSLFNPSTYTLTIASILDGIHAAAVSYRLVSRPSTPELLGLSAGQAIDNSLPYVVRWRPLGGSILDIVQLLITDHSSNIVFTSAAPFTPDALDGTSTEITLPPYTLPGSARLTGHLAIARPGLPNTNSVPGAIGIAALARETAFPLVTRPSPVPPRLEVISPGANPLILRFIGESNRVYQLQASTDFQGWTHLLTTNSGTGEGQFTDTEAAALPRRFYRLEVGSTNPAASNP